MTIRKVKRGGKTKYTVVSHTTGRNLGPDGTKQEAEKRLKQVRFFKNIRKSTGALRKKVRQKKLLKGG